MDVPMGKHLCLQCKKKELFLKRPGQRDELGKIYCECELLKQQKRHRRLALQKEKWQQKQQKQRNMHQDLLQKKALRQAQEEHWQQRESWYSRQPDHLCRMCRQMQPATAFGSRFSTRGFVLHTYCKACHEILLERSKIPCCICWEATPRSSFLSHLHGYALSDRGISLPVCCKGCETTFLNLSEIQQRQLLRDCCQRTFPVGQVIYAEVDPETSEVRYIGRTGKPRRRHKQHLFNASSTREREALEKAELYTFHDWIRSLSLSGLQPSMRILRPIEASALVIEWEQRYIYHGIQQGWKLLNREVNDEILVARAKASRLDFLAAPFEILVQQCFFSPYGLVAFLRLWCERDWLLI